MASLVFDEETLLNGNLFKFEQRLNSHVNKYVENSGMLLTTYYTQRQKDTTVDRGTRDIDELFGNHSPLRFSKIINCPLLWNTQLDQSNTDENQVEDIEHSGECVVIPDTIVPKQLDFFTINHLKMTAIFEVTAVEVDNMRPHGYYKIRYRLHSTSKTTLEQLEAKVLEKYHVDLNSVGSDTDPVIREDDYVYRNKIIQMTNQMISSYRALYYNDKHNCFMFFDHELGEYVFDMCGNEFMAKYSLMNIDNSSRVIVLNNKIHDIQMPLFYGNSIYTWLELDAPSRLLQKFYYILNQASGYPFSSFTRLGDEGTQIIQPISVQENARSITRSYFDDEQMNAFLDPNNPPKNEYEKLIWMFIHKGNGIELRDISLYSGDALINSIKHYDTFLYTPMIVYIIRKILRMS